MKVKILVIIEILLAIILLKFSITFALNKNFINNYNNKKYNEEDLAIIDNESYDLGLQEIITMEIFYTKMGNMKRQ